MVLVKVTLRMKAPLAEGGLAFIIDSIKAARDENTTTIEGLTVDEDYGKKD